MIRQISKVVGVEITRYCSHATLARQADQFIAVSISSSLSLSVRVDKLLHTH